MKLFSLQNRKRSRGSIEKDPFDIAQIPNVTTLRKDSTESIVELKGKGRQIARISSVFGNAHPLGRGEIIVEEVAQPKAVQGRDGVVVRKKFVAILVYHGVKLLSR